MVKLVCLAGHQLKDQNLQTLKSSEFFLHFWDLISGILNSDILEYL